MQLRIRIAAAALIALESLHLVSEEATVFKTLDAGDPSDLPVITGIDPAAFRSDLALRSSILVSAVALLHDYRDAGLWAREPIAEIHVEPDESFENALKRFKKQCEKAGLMSELRKRQHYEKPSVKRKRKTLAARKKAKKRERFFD